MKVFIADDSALVRDRLIAMISELPDTEIIGEAQDASEAMSLTQKLKPDVVILDIRMPRGNGISLLCNIKKQKPAPLVIMLTNYPYPQYRKKCMKEGADFFFDKSGEFLKVMEVLKKINQKSSPHRKTHIKRRKRTKSGIKRHLSKRC